MGAGVAYSTTEAAYSYVTTDAGVTHWTMGAGCNYTKTGAATNTGGADSAGRSAPISAISKISACATWRTGAVPKLSEVRAGFLGSQRFSPRSANRGISIVFSTPVTVEPAQTARRERVVRTQRTAGGASKTCAVTNIWMCGFCGQRFSDLDYLHNLGLCHMADRCSPQTLRGPSWIPGITTIFHDLQTVASRFSPSPVEPAQPGRRGHRPPCRCTENSGISIVF